MVYGRDIEETVRGFRINKAIKWHISPPRKGVPITNRGRFVAKLENKIISNMIMKRYREWSQSSQRELATIGVDE
jgi:hypothetical protein